MLLQSNVHFLMDARSFIILLFVLPAFAYLLFIFLSPPSKIDRRPDFNLSDLSCLKLILKEGWVCERVGSNIVLQFPHNVETFSVEHKLLKNITYGHQVILVYIYSETSKKNYIVAVYNKNFKRLDFDLDIRMMSQILAKSTGEYRFQRSAQYLRSEIDLAVREVLRNPYQDKKELAYII